MPTEKASAAQRVVGVDFSGARDAGNKIWIADGMCGPDGVNIDRCFAARDLPDSGPDIGHALPALVSHIAGLGDAVAGFDFPFSLPAPLIDQTDWIEFVAGFARRYPTPDEFRAACMTEAGGRELKRRTDVAARVPFSAYNLRLYRQTWQGIATLLCPLVAEDSVRVLPMQQPMAGKPTLAEACPASLLKEEDLYLSYKGNSDDHRAARAMIITGLIRRKALLPPSRPIRKTLLDNAGGDALDAVIAAICAARAAGDPTSARCADDLERIEARIFF